MEILTPREQIHKFSFEKHFDFVPQQRIQEIILGQPTAVFWRRECGMISDRKKRKNVRAFRRSRSLRNQTKRQHLLALTTPSYLKQSHFQKQNDRVPGGAIRIWKGERPK